MPETGYPFVDRNAGFARALRLTDRPGSRPTLKCINE